MISAVLLAIIIIYVVFFLMIRRPPRSTRTDTLFPYTTLFRSGLDVADDGNGRKLGIDGQLAAEHGITIGPLQNRVTVQGCVDHTAGGEQVPVAGKRQAAILRSGVGADPLGGAPFLGLYPEHGRKPQAIRSEEHTSELQSLMRISYAVFCLQKKNK